MTIHIEDLKFQCIIGILDFERTKPQDVIINVIIDYQFKDEYINYAEVVEYIKNSMNKNNFLLIEDALAFFHTHLKNKFPLIDYLNLKISKPSILPDAMVSVSNSYQYNS